MHSSCAQEMWIPIRNGYRNGTPVPNRCTTDTKIRIVAAAISEVIRISSSRSRIRSISPPHTPSNSGRVAIIFYAAAPVVPRASVGQIKKRAPATAPRGLARITSVAGSAGLLDELIDQGLTDPAGNVFVHRLHRLAHRSVLFRRQGDDLGLAGFLDLRKRVLVFLRRLAVAVSGGLLHGLFQPTTNISGKTIPELLVHDNDIADVAVIGDRSELLHLMPFLGENVRPGVLLAIDHAGLQRLVHLAERHDLRDRTERPELGLENLRRLDAKFQTLVVRGRDQLLVGAHLLETVVPVSKAGHSLWLEQFEQSGAERPVGHFAQ